MNLTSQNSTQNLFFKSDKKREFTDVLNEVQSYISSKYSALVIDGINNVNSGDDNIKQQVKRYIGKYLLDYRISVEGLSQTELVDKLYTEMAEFSFLTKYIFGTGIEEININSWDDIEVQYSNGTNVKIDEHFESPEHAINVVRRMLHVSGMVLDNTSPAILGHLSKNIRIAVLKTPLVDEDVGVAASIRIVNAQKLKKEDFLKSGTATDEMMELLSALVRYGVSTTVAGATSSGKTTLTGWLLTTISYDKRILTIESGSRELDLVVRDENDKILNKVVHTITRESEDDKKSVSQDDLLDMLNLLKTAVSKLSRISPNPRKRRALRRTNRPLPRRSRTRKCSPTPTKSRLTNPSRPRSSRSRKLLRILPNTVTEKTV